MKMDWSKYEPSWVQKMDKVVKNVSRFLKVHQKYLKKRNKKRYKHYDISDTLEYLKINFQKWKE